MTVAMDKENLVQVEEFYWYTAEQEWYSVLGKNKDNQTLYVFIDPVTKETQRVGAEELITEEEAQAITLYDQGVNELLRTNLGLYKGQPAWQISYYDEVGHLAYYTISAFDGSPIQLISNI